MVARGPLKFKKAAGGPRATFGHPCPIDRLWNHRYQLSHVQDLYNNNLLL